MKYILKNMKEYKVSVMASVPAIYEGIFKITRKQLEKQFIIHVSIVILISIISIALNYVFIFIMSKIFAPQIRMIIFTYLASLFLGILGFIIQNIPNKWKIIMIVLGLIIFIGTIFIPNQIISDIILLIMIILLYVCNKIIIRKIPLEG